MKSRSIFCVLFAMFSIVLGNESFEWCTDAQAQQTAQELQLRNPLLDKLFQVNSITVEKPQPHTFIFFVQGAADHLQPHSLNEVDQPWGNSDAQDVQEIKKLALNCQNCNVLLLHIQRGGAHWYLPRHPWATYFRGYSAGKKIFTRNVAILNAADPRVVTSLLTTAEKLFPNTDLHLVYRGHGFYPSYDPSQRNEIAPFDTDFRESPYGIPTFAQGIREAKLKKPLKTVTLAACSMAFLEVATQLAPVANHLIASQVDISETLKFGFSFDFLRAIPPNTHSPREIPQTIASHLLRKFEVHAESGAVIPEEAIMESPVTWIELDRFKGGQNGNEQDWNASFWGLLEKIQKLDPQAFRENLPQLIEKSRVRLALSNHYVEHLQKRGASEMEITNEAHLRAKPVQFQAELDLILFLNGLKAALGSSENESEISQVITELTKKLQETIHVFQGSQFASHSGLSFDGSSLNTTVR